MVINEGGVAAYALGAPAIMKVTVFIKEKVQEKLANGPKRTWQSLIDPRSKEDKPVIYTGENTPNIVKVIDGLTKLIEKAAYKPEEAPWEDKFKKKEESEESEESKEITNARIKAKLEKVVNSIANMPEKGAKDVIKKAGKEKIEADLSSLGFAFDYLKALQHSLHHLLTGTAGVFGSWGTFVTNLLSEFVEDEGKGFTSDEQKTLTKIFGSLVLITTVFCLLYPSLADLFSGGHSFGIMDMIDAGEIAAEALVVIEETVLFIAPAILTAGMTTEGISQVREIIKLSKANKIQDMKTDIYASLELIKDELKESIKVLGDMHEHVWISLNQEITTQSFKKSEEIVGTTTRGISSGDMKELSQEDRVKYLVDFLENKGKGLNTEELFNKIKDRDNKGIRNFSKNAGIDFSKVSTKDLLEDYAEAYKVVFSVDPYTDHPIGQEELNNSVKEALIREYISSLIKESYTREFYLKKVY
mgnify:CR=1 FL=1